MASGKFIKNLFHYLLIPVGFSIGMALAIVWSASLISESPGFVEKRRFPVDSLFIDLDKITMDKKGRIIDSVFNRLSTKGGFNGTVLYGEKGRLVFKKAYGFEEFKTKKRLTTGSAFQLASVSKMFTAMAVMILKEEGMLEYDDTVRQYIPELPYNGVTIRHLLNHRSGIPDYMHFADHHWNTDLPITNENIIRVMADHKPARFFTPGNGFDYCNSNYALLASVVERISGKSFDVFVREKIFDPLEMNDSFIYHLSPGQKIPPLVPVGVPGHRPGRGIPRPEPDFYQNGVMGDKGVYSTVEDLFKWDQALYQEILVSETTLQEAFAPGSPKFSKYIDNYGFGWRLKADRERTVYHYGWWKGFRTYFIRDLKQEKCIIVLTNTTRSLSSSVLYEILDNKQYELGRISHFSPTGKTRKKVLPTN